MTLAASFAQLTLRLALGMALAMGMLSAKEVPAPFFRVHLWIVMGLNTFAALLLGRQQTAGSVLWLVVGAAVVAYAISVVWLYESAWIGRIGLFAVGVLDFLAAWGLSSGQNGFDIASGGALFGIAVTAMLLGHWYLNTPMMRLAPLQRLIILLAIAVVARVVVEVLAGRASIEFLGQIPPSWLVLRWLAGIGGTLAVVGMVWQTLKIPNTQSATGLLYVVVVLVFLGESISVFLTA